MSDVLSLQEEIAEAISSAVRGRLRGGDSQFIARVADIEAVNHYLWGRFHWNKRDEPGLHTGIAHFREAIRIDPEYARAYAGLADCYIMLANSAAEKPAACMPLAGQAAVNAIDIDDKLVEAHTSLAVVRANFDWDRAASEVEFQRAFECDPSYATLHHWYSLYSLAPEGRFDEAEDEIEWAERLDPVSLPINLGHALVLYLRDNAPAAVNQCEKVLRLDPTYYRAYWFLGLAYDRTGDFAAAVHALETAKAQCGDEVAFRGRILGALGHACGRWGRADRATAVLEEMNALSGSRYVDSFDFAQVKLAMGETDAALDHLEQAAEERSGYLMFCGVWPTFDSLRREERFKRLLELMSLRSLLASGKPDFAS